MRDHKRFTWILSCLAALGSAVFLPGVEAQPPGPRAMPVEARAATVDTVTEDVTAVGTLRAAESVLIRPEIPGRIEAIRFSEGQAVKQGAELVTLDATEYRAQVAESAATVKLDTLSFERSQGLLKKQLISRQQYDEAVAKLAASRAKLALDEARLSKTVLRAPFDGILGLRKISPGDYVQAGQDIVNLEAVDPVKADFRVPEIHAAKVRTGQAIEISLDAFPGRFFKGTVYAVDPRIEEETRTMMLRARVANPGGELRPGMFARVRLELGRRENAVLVPEESLVPMGKDIFVYRVVDGKAAMTKVQIGQRRDAMVEILQGVNAGDMVVTAGQMKIGDGAPVAVVTAPGQPQEPAAKGG